MAVDKELLAIKKAGKRTPTRNQTEIAEMLGVDQSTVSRMMKRDELNPPQHFRTGNKKYYRLDEVELWVKKMKDRNAN